MGATIRRVISLLLLLVFVWVSVSTAFGAEATTPTGIPLSEVGARIDALVANEMEMSTPGCAIAIVKDGEIVFSRGYGYADVAKGLKVDADTTVFEYGSISKTFVYVSVMQLVEQGKLDLDASISTYLPEDLYRQLDFTYDFTVRDLMNHSAGFGENMFNSFMDAESAPDAISLRDALIATQPDQIYTPGTASSYSNFGNALAAYVVSQVSGQDYAAYEKQHILDPLGMTDTKNQPDWLGDTAFLQNKARGYAPASDGVFPPAPWWQVSIYPAGAINGTAHDLALFAQALLPPTGDSGPLFEGRATLDEMLSPSYEDARVMRGTHHGFFVYDGVEPTFGHGGQTGGFNTDLALVPTQRFGVAVLSNANGGMAFNNKVLDLLLGNTIDSLPASSDGFPNAYDLTGEYLSYRRHSRNVLALVNPLMAGIQVKALDENTIELSTMGISQEYRQVEPYVFRATTPDTLTRFVHEVEFRVEDGKPVGISMNSPFDASTASWGESMAALMLGAIVVVISLLFFVVAPLVVLIRYLRRKERGLSPFVRVSNGLLVSGMLLVFSVVALIMSVLANFSPVGPFVQSAVVNPFIWLNYALLVVIVALIIASLYFLGKEKVHPKRKVLYSVTLVLLVAFLIMLWQWNFLTLM